MNEFLVVLCDDDSFDIIMDGECVYNCFTPQDLKEFAESFIFSNSTDE